MPKPLTSVLIAPDSFKGSLSAPQAAAAIARGWQRAWPAGRVQTCPLADGGEGSAEVLRQALGGRWIKTRAQDPLGRPVEAGYALVEGGKVAVVEVAQASGLTHLRPEERDPLAVSTFGTGELIRHALERWIEALWLCLGGSATVDGGLGLLAALGAVGRDARGRTVSSNGAGLLKLTRLDLKDLDPRLRMASCLALCDVDNRLLGPTGAAVYMPQKGASPDQVAALEAALARWAEALKEATGQDVRDRAGAGAAGGLGAGAAAGLGARLVPGIEFVLETLDFDRLLAKAGLVLSGEGRVDAQTAHGKVVAGVARRARQAGVPVIVLCGRKGTDLEPLYRLGVSAVLSILPGPAGEAEAMEKAEAWLEEAAFSLARALRVLR